MPTPLKVLFVEDSEDDAMLVLRELRRGGFALTFERVDTRPAFKAALARTTWDIIISDYSLPQYSGLLALSDTREIDADLPFILVSGTIGENVAVEAMRAGAQDYVLKDQLTRLCMAVERETREARLRAEQRRMREQLIISERMASAGTLAAGVAHEINNPLAVVIANLHFVVSELEASSWADGRLAELAEPLADAGEAVGRIRDIVRDVKLFSRPHEEQRGAVNVERVLDSSIRMAWNEIRHRAQIVKEYSHVPRVEANEARLGQVFLNLIVNAAQAIPEGNAKQNKIRVATRTEHEGSIVVEVSDTGMGISRDHIDRIYDAFFTTKPVGVGTGLGLSICHRIVNDLHGRIEVESEVGKGTLFRVTLPVGASEVRMSTQTGPTPPFGRRARVLIVDDEEALARALRRQLSMHHEVSSLTTGAETIALVESGARLDVIVSDLMMPQMTGMEIHERLMKIAPDQAERMIFLTGGAFTTGAREFLDRVRNPRLEKPVDIASLLVAIAAMTG